MAEAPRRRALCYPRRVRQFHRAIDRGCSRSRCRPRSRRSRVVSGEQRHVRHRRNPGRRRRAPACQHHQDAAAVDRRHAALAGQPAALDAGRGRHLPGQPGQGRRARPASPSSAAPATPTTLPSAFVDYEEQPREYTLSTVTTTIDVQTRISDLYRSPMDQVQEQLGVLIEMVKERQENELINNANYGLLNNVAPSMRITTRNGRARRPTTSTS